MSDSERSGSDRKPIVHSGPGPGPETSDEDSLENRSPETESRERFVNEPKGGADRAQSDEHLIEMWLEEKSDHTRRAYETDIEEFIDYVDLPIQAIKFYHIQDFRNHLQERGLSTNTVSRRIAAVKSLFSFAAQMEYVRYNTARPVITPTPRKEKEEKLLTQGEVHRIIGMAKKTSHPFRNEALLRLFYAGGVRRSELEGLEWKRLDPRPDLNPPRGQVTVWGKGEKERTVLVTKKSWECLMNLRTKEQNKGRGGPEDPVFRSRKGGPLSASAIYRVVKKAADKAEIDGKSVSPHSFRHAHISHALQNGASLHIVQETVGHSSMQVTSEYSHSRPNESSSDFLSD